MIPRRIIQTGKTKDFSPREKAAVTSMKLLHPDWDYIFFDDVEIDAFLKAEYPQYREAWQRFPRKIQQIDFFRYLAVNRLGGFYFDLDVFLSSSLDNLLGEGCVFPFEELTLNRYLREECGIDWEIGNYAFGSASGHPYLEAVISNCLKAQSDPSWMKQMMRGVPPFFRGEFEVLNTTGPGLLTRTLAENPGPAAQVTVLFPPDVCDPAGWHLFGDYGVHMMEGSWRERGGFVRRRLLGVWETRMRNQTLPASRSKGPARDALGKREHPGRNYRDASAAGTLTQA